MRSEVECMPDWQQSAAREIDGIDWEPFVELAKEREPTPRAALTEVA